MRAAAALWLLLSVQAEEVRVPGLQRSVEVLRDRWGVPHIYAQSQHDLFFAQGYMVARDRLFQLDLWRRQGTGKLAEALGPAYVERDRLALLLRYRGDWKQEWPSYAPDTWSIVQSFVAGINAWIQDPARKPSPEFRKLGYEPGLWTANDVVSRMAVFSMMSNLLSEAQRARLVATHGAPAIEKWLPPDPFIRLINPRDLNLQEIRTSFLSAVEEAAGGLGFAGQGSNNWVVSGRRSATGKPLLANDPHRSFQIPSLRRTVHLVAPGWNVFGAGEPALPGIALGHNETIGFGFTITGTDQQDLYIERLHPTDPTQYLYKGQWRRLETERHAVAVKGGPPRTVETQYSLHGPVVGMDLALRRAYVMRWTGAEPGTAGYLAALSLARAKDWKTFLSAVARYKAPAENLVYADAAGHIGFAVTGLTPIRKGWSGLLPVPGHTGEYEWQGFRKPEQLPHAFDPPAGFFATANNNILPPRYPHPIQYEWAPDYRARSIAQALRARRRWTLDAMETLQGSLFSPPAKRLIAIAGKWNPPAGSKAASVLPLFRSWDARMTKDSVPAALYLMWMSRLAAGIANGPPASIERTLQTLERSPRPELLARTLDAVVAEFEKGLGKDRTRWQYGNLHFLHLRHPAGEKSWDRGPLPLGGDAHSINVAAGPGYRVTLGASFRMLLDVADWDRSRMTNMPGESGDPSSPHYADLLDDWSNGRYHPMPFTRQAVEAATRERILLVP
ncbi:MAG TPA: penicillin acylase family protein [Bryobacteraceae bacterium]|nr:penicillin acylase family protein [Bryobacteraceae bacterium]